MIMNDEHFSQCCPVLRWHAEVQRLAEHGMVLEFDAAQPLLIGRLRERYGCPGPGNLTRCPWWMPVGRSLWTDPAIASLHRYTDDGRKSPGQML